MGWFGLFLWMTLFRRIMGSRGKVCLSLLIYWFCFCSTNMDGTSKVYLPAWCQMCIDLDWLKCACIGFYLFKGVLCCAIFSQQGLVLKTVHLFMYILILRLQWPKKYIRQTANKVLLPLVSSAVKTFSIFYPLPTAFWNRKVLKSHHKVSWEGTDHAWEGIPCSGSFSLLPPLLQRGGGAHKEVPPLKTLRDDMRKERCQIFWSQAIKDFKNKTILFYAYIGCAYHFANPSVVLQSVWLQTF